MSPTQTQGGQADRRLERDPRSAVTKTSSSTYLLCLFFSVNSDATFRKYYVIFNFIHHSGSFFSCPSQRELIILTDSTLICPRHLSLSVLLSRRCMSALLADVALMPYEADFDHPSRLLASLTPHHALFPPTSSIAVSTAGPTHHNSLHLYQNFDKSLPTLTGVKVLIQSHAGLSLALLLSRPSLFLQRNSIL